MVQRVLSILVLRTGLIRRMSTMSSAQCQCYRLGAVSGHENKINDVILCTNPNMKAVESHVVFFGGDVQDYQENMESYLPHQKYVQWNLEATAKIIHLKYPRSMVWVIRPKVLLNNTFSIYSNFLASNFNGAPDQRVPFENQGSWFHLQRLFHNAIETAQKYAQGRGAYDGPNIQEHTSQTELTDSQPIADESLGQCDKYKSLPNTNDGEKADCNKGCDGKNLAELSDVLALRGSNLNHTSLPLHVIGFSKGCVVLNQLLFDLNQCLESDQCSRFLHQVRSMTWLDGGHAGGKHTWVTQKEVLSHLKRLQDFTVRVHVTPYQVKDELRIWIGREQRHFTRTLRQLQVPFHEKLHFSDEDACLDNHFRVLTVF